MSLPRLHFIALALVLLTPLAPAHDAKEINKHPGLMVAFNYLRATTEGNWKGAAGLIEAESLEGFRDRFVKRCQEAPAGDQLRKTHFGELKLDKIAALDPVDFYSLYRSGSPDRIAIDQKLRDEILVSLAIKVIAQGEETVGEKTYCHFVLRTRHQEHGKRVSHVQLVSLSKTKNGGWEITLDARRPQFDG